MKRTNMLSFSAVGATTCGVVCGERHTVSGRNASFRQEKPRSPGTRPRNFPTAPPLAHPLLTPRVRDDDAFRGVCVRVASRGDARARCLVFGAVIVVGRPPPSPPPARPWIASPQRHARSVGWGWRRCATVARAAAAASDPPLPKVLVIAGPTAVGKTALSLRLAAALDGEIVSADSVQVFTGLDVGSSKLPESERAGIPHHMLDLLDPSLELGAGEFCDRAWAVMEDIVARGKTPVVVGGTGMYLRWLVEGKPPTPPSDPAAAAAARAAIAAAVADAEIEARATAAVSGADPEIAARAAGWRAATRLLSDAGDAESASKIAENDWYRVERALEIVTASGRPVGSFAPVAPPAFDFRCVILTRPRVALYRRVDARVEAMTRDGMLEEAAGMLEAGIAPGAARRRVPSGIARRWSSSRGERMRPLIPRARTTSSSSFWRRHNAPRARLRSDSSRGSGANPRDGTCG